MLMKTFLIQLNPVSGDRNKYLFALTKKFSSVASENLVRWITFFSVQVNI